MSRSIAGRPPSVGTGAFLPLHFFNHRSYTTPCRGTHVVALPLEGDCSRFCVIRGALSKLINHKHGCPLDCTVVAQSLCNPWNWVHFRLPAPTHFRGFGDGKDTKMVVRFHHRKSMLASGIAHLGRPRDSGSDIGGLTYRYSGNSGTDASWPPTVTAGGGSSWAPRARICSAASGSGRCRVRASSASAESHRSHSCGVVRITGMALLWTGATMLFGMVVRNP